MNRQEKDILLTILDHTFVSQRILAELSGHSLGIVNKSLRSLSEHGYLDKYNRLTTKAIAEIRRNSPKSAIILAAGFGMRMVPINTETPKALLKVHGEVLIERLIRQLHEAGINNINVVVGFMKEKFEYLIDEYNIRLIINMEYASKNNLHSLFKASDHILNTYIIPCDIWCRTNPFHASELYSWYMVSDVLDPTSSVRIIRNLELKPVSAAQTGNKMVGIAYLARMESQTVRNILAEMDMEPQYNNSFWEEAVFKNGTVILQAKIITESQFKEINTYEQLREFDEQSDHLKSEAILTIESAFNTTLDKINDIQVLKKGMTNRSFLFSCNERKYIMRIPGEGTEQLINRQHEASVYKALSGLEISDDVIYINSDNGYKITSYWNESRVCDCNRTEDIILCMKKLKFFHQLKLNVAHTFNIFDTIDFYESLWPSHISVYKDYDKVKANVFSLWEYINENSSPYCLTHIDAVPDNFLILPGNEVRIIDWEYAGMQDPHVDIAMFCIYSLYEKEQIDQLIDIYFEDSCPFNIRLKIYCYISVCGLLWSNWCEYKRNLGIEFGEYSLRQYRYAKEYYDIVRKHIG